jgi:alpha-L-rhamnosidase
MTPGTAAWTRALVDRLRPETEMATAYLAHSSRTLARIAEVLGRDEDAARYHELADNVVRAWQLEFLAPDGQIRGGGQSAYVRALAFELLPPGLRPGAADRLVALIRENGNHLDTGALTTGLLLAVLTATGHLDVAYDLLRQPSYPSWLAQVWQGATTMWESWDGVDKSGAARKSLNHTAFGAVVAWIFETVVGISRLEPGYRRVRLAPHIGAGLTRAAGRIRTPFGPLALTWRIDGNLFTLLAEIPVGVTATVRLPGVRADDVREGDYGAYPVHAEGVRDVVQSGPDTVVEIGSGSYRFTYQLAASPLPVVEKAQ